MTEEEKQKRSEALKAALSNEESRKKISEGVKAAAARNRAAKAAAIAALEALLCSQ
jgi:hypothetical protein